MAGQPKPERSAEKEARLAAALRRNLRRRKEASSAGEGDRPDDVAAAPVEGPPDSNDGR